MVEAALRAATTLDDHNFEDYAFSVKASELNLCVSAYEQLAKRLMHHYIWVLQKPAVLQVVLYYHL